VRHASTTAAAKLPLQIPAWAGPAARSRPLSPLFRAASGSGTRSAAAMAAAGWPMRPPNSTQVVPTPPSCSSSSTAAPQARPSTVTCCAEPAAAAGSSSPLHASPHWQHASAGTWRQQPGSCSAGQPALKTCSCCTHKPAATAAAHAQWGVKRTSPACRGACWAAATPALHPQTQHQAWLLLPQLQSCTSTALAQTAAAW
jgi:hypothetical protein